jgi:hypothetical protein
MTIVSPVSYPNADHAVRRNLLGMSSPKTLIWHERDLCYTCVYGCHPDLPAGRTGGSSYHHGRPFDWSSSNRRFADH